MAEGAGYAGRKRRLARLRLSLRVRAGVILYHTQCIAFGGRGSFCTIHSALPSAGAVSGVTENGARNGASSVGAARGKAHPGAFPASEAAENTVLYATMSGDLLITAS
jgi:hypothetical protein